MPESPLALKGRTPRGASQRVRTGSRTSIACINCKERKLRCDEQAPECSNCRRSGIGCLVEDPTTKRQLPRNYLQTLEQHVVLLEGMLQKAGENLPGPSKDSTMTQLLDDQSAGRVRLTGDDDEASNMRRLSSMVGTLSLNAAGAEPRYLGPSSMLAFARFITPSLRQALSSTQEAHGDDAAPEPCPLPDQQTANRLSNAYFQNIHPQYPFLHEPTFRSWEAAMGAPFDAANALSYSPVPLCILNMVYSIGALLLPSAGCSPERLYTSGLLYIDDILCHDNLECIQVILCCATYSLRSSQGTSHWKLAGQALRHCVNLGYHRSNPRLGMSVTVTPLQRELQKRAFWTAYVMECSAAVMLGRPLSLHFQEIDTEFPLDVDDVYITHETICAPPRTLPADPPTMMTYAIHAFRIRILQGLIQTSLYSDFSFRDPNVRADRVQDMLAKLTEWRGSTPPPIAAPPGGALSFFTTQDWFAVNDNHATLQLYRSQITEDGDSSPPLEVFRACLDAAENTCHSYRRQFLGRPTTYTWGALHDLFVAGLTYLYCLWASPALRAETRQDQVSSTCTDCTMVLVLLAERWPDAAPYRDLFDALAARTMTMMVDAQHGGGGGGGGVVPSAVDEYPDDLAEWMAGIVDTGMSPGLDRLLSGLIDDFSPGPGVLDGHGGGEGSRG